MKILRPAMFAALASAVLACADKTEEQAALTPGTVKGRPPIDPDLVAAVSEQRSKVPVDLRFALQGKPAVGKPVDLRIALTPLQSFEGVQTTYEVGEGLEFAGDWLPLQLSKPEVGVVANHTITVVPQRDGIFFITVTVVVDSSSGSTSRSYSVPIIAGKGVS